MERLPTHWPCQVTTGVRVQLTASLGLTNSSDGQSSNERDGDGNYIFLSSDQYLAAALYAGGQQLYQSSPFPFSYNSTEGDWSIIPFTLPTHSIQAIGDGSPSTAANVSVDTYGIKTSANCSMASISFGDNNTVTATVDECSYDFIVRLDTNFTRWHFADTTPCNNASRYDIAFKTFIYADYDPLGYAASDPSQFAVMFCQPVISIAKVSATLSVTRQGEIGALIAPPTIHKEYHVGSDADDPNIAGLLWPPLNGMAINGYDIAEPPNTTLLSRAARVNVTQSILFQGIYGALLDRLPPEEVQWCTSLYFHLLC